MPEFLRGGCFVTKIREGTPSTFGTLSIWNHVGRNTGAKAISLRVLEFAPGVSSLRNEDCDQVLYFLENLDSIKADERVASIFIDGSHYEIRPRTGIFLRPLQTLTVKNPGQQCLLFVSSQCPEPQLRSEPCTPQTSPDPQSLRPETLPVLRLEDREPVNTGDRWYRVLVDDSVGSRQVTQFIGCIPPGRAPDHFHKYEEVLVILRGTGRMWAGDLSTDIGPGSCVYLPPGQVHCVENTVNDELRLLGVFYPAGSPSTRYEK